MLPWIVIAASVIAVDQLAKILVTKFISETACVHVIPYLFDFVYVKNTGAAFSMFSKNTGFLSLVSVLFCAGVLVYWYRKKPQHPLLKTALTLLFAGAFGNAIDRIFRGFVVDFISTAFMEFPVFNVADIAIVFGAIALIVYMTFFDKEECDGENNADDSQPEQAED